VTGEQSGMPTPLKALILLAVTGLAACIAALVLLLTFQGPANPPTTNAPPSSSFAGLSVEPFSFIDQDGTPATEGTFDDQVTILQFFFTSCPLACPGMTAAMMQVDDALADTDVRFAGISVDGATDAPERLRAYAEQYGMDPERWTLMTGPQDEVRALLENGLGLTIRVDETFEIELDDGGVTRNVIHPTRLLLIAPDRSLAFAASYTRQDEIELLIERARELVVARDR
jgi:protein SCO1/2